MSKFEDEYHKRLRRLCGVTDDTYRVYVDEEVDEGYRTCFECNPDDYGSFDYGPSFKVTIYAYPPNQTYWQNGSSRVTFEGLAELMSALDEVEL